MNDRKRNVEIGISAETSFGVTPAFGQKRT